MNGALFPQILWIIEHLMVREHLQVLFLKASLAMVLHLIIDVSQHCIGFGPTDGECAVAVLPMKLKRTLFSIIDMFARIRLQLAYKIGDCCLRGDMSYFGWSMFFWLKQVQPVINKKVIAGGL